MENIVVTIFKKMTMLSLLLLPSSRLWSSLRWLSERMTDKYTHKAILELSSTSLGPSKNPVITAYIQNVVTIDIPSNKNYNAFIDI